MFSGSGVGAIEFLVFALSEDGNVWRNYGLVVLRANAECEGISSVEVERRILSSGEFVRRF